MARALKEYLTADLEQIISLDVGFVAVDFRGLDSGETFDFRKTIWAAGGSLHVVPNRLSMRVMQGILGDAANNGAGEVLNGIFKGPTALVRLDEGGVNEFVVLARALAEWCKKSKKVTVKGGLVCGDVVGPAGVDRLASLPDRDTLYSQVAGMVQAPLRNAVSVVQQTMTKVVYAAKAYQEKLDE